MKGQIINIICPTCKDFSLFKRRLTDGDFQWQCPNCVYIYSSDWFDKFHQFERFVTRKINIYNTL